MCAHDVSTREASFTLYASAWRVCTALHTPSAECYEAASHVCKHVCEGVDEGVKAEEIYFGNVCHVLIQSHSHRSETVKL